MEPNGSINISGSLFFMDEKLMNNNNLNSRLVNSQLVSNWNSIPMDQGTGVQLPAYINQSRLSTWYQDNGNEPVLQFANQYGLNVMGGNFRGDLTPGSRPGNITPSDDVSKPGYALYNKKYYPVSEPPSILNSMRINTKNGISTPSFVKDLKFRPYNGN